MRARWLLVARTSGDSDRALWVLDPAGQAHAVNFANNRVAGDAAAKFTGNLTGAATAKP